jgi:hypothetical protein
MRLSTNINAIKALDSFQTFRLQRRSIDLPLYEVIISLKEEGARELLSALKKPHYPIYLGDSNHLGKILNVEEIKSPTKDNWAYKTQDIEMEEYVWNTHLGLNGNRLRRDGYWNYPKVNSKKELPTFESCYE